MSNQGNQWAYLTQYTIKNDLIDVGEYGYLNGLSTLYFSGIAPATPQIMTALKDWMNNPGVFPFEKREWMCLYCASPNPLYNQDRTGRTHCSQCGAPRSWLIG